jgi:hypothetical protein
MRLAVPVPVHPGRTFALLGCLAALPLSSCGPLPGEPGAACAADKSCKKQSCLKGFPDGYCAARCDSAACDKGTACVGTQGGNFCLQTCTDIGLECRAGYVCRTVGDAGVCMPPCKGDVECGSGAKCDERGSCVANNPGKVGAPCLSNAGCQTRYCESDLPQGGYCAGRCKVGTTESRDCPEDSTCSRVGENFSLCLKNCSAQSDCRDAYYCDVLGTSGVCRPKCQKNADCGSGYACDAATGKCREGSASPGKIGASCGVGKTCDGTNSKPCDDECESKYCLTEQTEDWPSGNCSDDCTAAGFKCPDNGVCIKTSSTSICLQRCTSNFDCRAAYYCAQTVNGTSAVCIPRCTAVKGICQSEVCDQASGSCVPKGTVPVAPGALERQSLGNVQLSTAESATLKVNVPSDAVSMTVVLKGDGLDQTTAPYYVKGPDGRIIYDVTSSRNSQLLWHPISPGGEIAFMYPNNPRLGLRPPSGTWTVSFFHDGKGDSGEVVSLVKKSSSPSVGGGTMPMNVYFAKLDGANGFSTLTAANARSHAYMTRVVTETARLFAQRGVTLDVQDYYDLPAAEASELRNVDTTEGAGSQLARACKLSKMASKPGANLVLVNEARTESGIGLNGIASGIPGIPYEMGTTASCVLVTMQDYRRKPEDLAITVVHEHGHWMGLYHVTERSGRSFDPLPDTPECDASNDKNGNGAVEPSECVGKGADHVMFWTASPTGNPVRSRISDNQQFVLLRNPLIK